MTSTDADSDAARPAGVGAADRGGLDAMFGPTTAPTSVSVPSTSSTLALTWVDDNAFAAGHSTTTGWLTSEDLLSTRPRRSPAATLVPILIVLAVIGAYVAGTALWPLDAIRPQLTTDTVSATAAPAANLTWPAKGSAAVVVDGLGTPLASTQDPATIASITKVVTSLMILDKLPLKPGEQGPSYPITAADGALYRTMQRAGESVLKVPVGGSLTEYQLLQGGLIGSAGNYVTKLARSVWSSDSDFASASRVWLNGHGLTGISLVGPTGISKFNRADPASLIALGKLAMANPVVAEIVGTKQVVLPGAGLVKNTNDLLLAEPGVVGIKTGTLDTADLLAAKDVTIGSTKVRLYATTLGQPDDKARNAETSALFAQLEKQLTPFPSVPKGTTVGTVTTKWGDSVPVVTTTDAAVVLWNAAKGTVATDVAVKDADTKGAKVGTLTVTGPLDKATTDVVLAEDITAPSFWWRLTHPLALIGLG